MSLSAWITERAARIRRAAAGRGEVDPSEADLAPLDPNGRHNGDQRGHHKTDGHQHGHGSGQHGGGHSGGGHFGGGGHDFGGGHH